MSFKIFVYGKSEEYISNIRNNLNTYSTEKILLTDDLSESMVVNHCLVHYPGAGQMMFINADTMKKVDISGSESIRSVISKTESYLEDSTKPYVILFNRYLDCGTKTHYLGEIISSVSLFRSFDPGNSDCFYLSTGVVSKLRDTFPNIGSLHLEMKRIVFTYIRKGIFDCFSFNPNLYTFRIQDSLVNSHMQYYKLSPIKHEETTNINNTVSNFFSSHIIIFWIFIVFFICTVLIIGLRLTKWGEQYLF